MTSSSSPAFDVAYAALDAEFGARGELERRVVIERWVDTRKSYHLLVARDEHGTFAGVRDCHVLQEDGATVVYLAHVLVLPPFRRSGLGALFRRIPITLAGQADVDVLLAAEMEPPSRDDPSSLVRLVAYGKDGFSMIPPEVLPYRQPDFSEGTELRPIPLRAVVRWVGREDARTLPRRLARAYVRALYRVFATHVAEAHCAELESTILDVLERHPSSEIPLVALPRSLDDALALAVSVQRVGTRGS